MLTPEQINENWDKFLDNIHQYILDEEKKEKLLEFYQKYEDRFAIMPASSKHTYHNCFAGGYVDHVNRVVDFALKINQFWVDNGSPVDYTIDELVFVAINHDLGKFGDLDNEQFIQNDSDWHVKNRGEVYKYNPELPYLKTSERSIFTLQQLGIKMTFNEFIAIKLHDGLYEESNKSYYISYSDEYSLKSNLPYIIHQADLTATRIEKTTTPGVKKEVSVKKSYSKKSISEIGSGKSSNLINMLNNL